MEDITAIFLALRSRSQGREAFTEIGDFVAHRDERVKGITTRKLREFLAVLRFINFVDEGKAPVPRRRNV